MLSFLDQTIFLYSLLTDRYVNDDSDKESLDEDSSDEDDEHGFDADVEPDNDEDRTTAPKRVIRRHRRSAHSGDCLLLFVLFCFVFSSCFFSLSDILSSHLKFSS